MDIKEILKLHEKWILNSSEGKRADLRGAYLSGANLKRTKLRGANLRGSDLSGANLSEAYLSEADLSGADLYGANLSEADLCGADLSGANLSEAYLYGANLSEADLSGVDLSEADLSEADLSGADLSGADLRSANLSRASGLNVPYVCPIEGSFIGFKRALSEGDTSVIIKLLIPEDAKRSSATTRKCRCDKAKVLDIQTLEGESIKDIIAHSYYAKSFTYKIGTIVSVDNFNEDRFKECAPGIHFFIDRSEAVNYK